MADSIRERLLAAIEAKCVAINGFAFARNPEGQQREANAIYMIDGESLRDYENDECNSDAYTLGVSFEIFSDDLDRTELSAAYAALVAALGDDASLGGLADDFKEVAATPQNIETEGGAPIAGMLVDYEANYRTKRGDPTQLG